MPVNLLAPVAADLHAIAGVRIGVAEAGVRKANRKDLTVFLLDEGVSVAGVFTQNRFCAAPVQISREHLASGQAIRAMVINTGNANAGTGADGLVRARATCIALARQLNVAPEQILPFSTGVIMEPLPHERIEAGLPAAIADAQPGHWARAAEGIMTTDTLPKAFSAQVQIGGATVSITGISKGAGMIRPNMATMLGFMATDACVHPSVMQQLARELADGSFNRVTIDGDTSTNDSFVVVATNRAAHAPITALASAEGQALKAAMLGVAQKLAQAIVRDGEGATKFITVRVEGGKTGDECRQVAYAIAHSPLVKTAFYASDPNLGRILAAVGYAGIADLDQTGIDLYLDDVHVAVKGGRNPAYREEDGQRVMKQSEITVRVLLGRGDNPDETADTALLRAECALHLAIETDYPRPDEAYLAGLWYGLPRSAGWVAGRRPTLPALVADCGLPASLADALELDDADPAGVGAMHPLLLLLAAARHLGSADWQERIAEVSRLSGLESASLVALRTDVGYILSGHAAYPALPGLPVAGAACPTLRLSDDPYRYAGMLGLLTAAFVDLDATTIRDRLAIACPLFGLHTPPVLLGCGEDGRRRPLLGAAAGSADLLIGELRLRLDDETSCIALGARSEQPCSHFGDGGPPRRSVADWQVARWLGQPGFHVIPLGGASDTSVALIATASAQALDSELRWR